MTDSPLNFAPRRLALTVLNKFNPAAGDAAAILHDMIEQTDRKAHATDLVFGVIRNRQAIDMAVKQADDSVQ